MGSNLIGLATMETFTCCILLLVGALYSSADVTRQETFYTTGKLKERFFIQLDSLAIDSLYKDGKYERWHNNGRREAVGFFKKNARDSRWEFWWKNGQKKEEGYYSAGQREGSWKGWWDNGERMYEGYYKYGQQEGKWSEWHRNGQPRYTGYYTYGKKGGKWTFWDKQGLKIKETYYENDGIIRSEDFN